MRGGPRERRRARPRGLAPDHLCLAQAARRRRDALVAAASLADAAPAPVSSADPSASDAALVEPTHRAGLGLRISTVRREWRRLGLGRLPRVEPTRLVRYERDRPREFVHLDVKKLGRIQRIGHRIHRERRAVRRTQRHCRARAHRQRELLSLPALRRGRAGPRHRKTLHAALSPADQREGRALDPHSTHRVGVRASGWRTRALPHCLSFNNVERRHSALGDQPQRRDSPSSCQQRAEPLHLDHGAKWFQVRLDFSRPGKPVEYCV